MSFTLLDVSEIQERGRQIAAPLFKVAERAGLSSGGIYRSAKNPGIQIKLTTVLKLNEALHELEREQLRRLAELHPDVIEELARRRPRVVAA